MGRKPSFVLEKMMESAFSGFSPNLSSDMQRNLKIDSICVNFPSGNMVLKNKLLAYRGSQNALMHSDI